MFEKILRFLAKELAQQLNGYQQARNWTKTQECKHCGKSVSVDYHICGHCGRSMYLTDEQVQMAQEHTVQVSIVPSQLRDTDHTVIYKPYIPGEVTRRYLKTGQFTEPIRLSPHQTRQLMRRLDI